ncbi:unnamed protein product [Clonostachys chloroleuca]|uniref:Tse2 ADP-ribosyltransferase toxin domain-containing protein n=1 Tax=Clonostachys chloroleuca TaxID=1926264 RepID=A0AA35LX57_9HYPO|nr:unnamed protein product [Clonostachys chloroleuca]
MGPLKLIQTFNKFPKEIFRVNNGIAVKARSWSPQRRVYDIVADGGMVIPKALDPTTYTAPNGVSLRPNSPYQQSLVSWRFRGQDIRIYAVPQGTEIPNDLILVHERSVHYSLQPASIMTLEHFNKRITQFLTSNSTVFTKEEWLQMYPDATDNS